MSFTKFSFLLIALVMSAEAMASRFSPRSCLDAQYSVTISRKGLLFGLLTHKLTIEKKGCLVHITHRKYFPHEWMIDVCREPVHIKVTSTTGVDVAKKENECINKDKSRDTSNFCSQYFNLIDVIQDDGLIFAEGDRDTLSTDHGKTFCSYLLMRKYLNESVIFSRYTEVQDIFSEKASNDDTAIDVAPMSEKPEQGAEGILPGDVQATPSQTPPVNP